MPLPIKTEDLFKGNKVESDRLDYKKGLDPQKIAHTICAFANDINNIGGGYIVVGVEDNKGTPKLPPVGLRKTEIESFQKKIIEIQHKVKPFPLIVVSPEIYQRKSILVIWVPGGESRPYKAPVIYTGKEYKYYIRRHSTTAKANESEEKRLLEISASIPFDDRVNHNCDISDISKDRIMDFLKNSDSGLYKSAKNMSLKKLCRAVQLCRGPKENLRPLNIGLLMFSDNPERYFKGAKIEIVEYEDDIGKEFNEKIFTGPLYRQLIDALAYIKNMVIKEKVIKIAGEAKAKRFYNYPYQAIEEALANAVYHRGYDKQDPIELNVFSDRIEIISKPGPMPPITNNDLKKKRVTVREYRNRRIGEFLKELDLTEARGTGLPEIWDALKNNGSPKAEFKTNKDRTYFLAVFKIHKAFAGKQKASAKKQLDTENVPSLSQVCPKSLTEVEAARLLKFVIKEKSLKDVMKKLGKTNRTRTKNQIIKPLEEKGLISMTLPDNPNSSKQKYIITELGEKTMKKG